MNPTRAQWLAVYSILRHQNRARRRLTPLVKYSVLVLWMARYGVTNRESRDSLACRWAIAASIWRSGAHPSPGLVKGLMETFPIRITPRSLP